MTDNQLIMMMVRRTSWYKTGAIGLEERSDHVRIYPMNSEIFNAAEVLTMLDTAGFSTYITYDHEEETCFARTY